MNYKIIFSSFVLGGLLISLSGNSAIASPAGEDVDLGFYKTTIPFAKKQSEENVFCKTEDKGVVSAEHKIAEDGMSIIITVKGEKEGEEQVACAFNPKKPFVFFIKNYIVTNKS